MKIKSLNLHLNTILYHLVVWHHRPCNADHLSVFTLNWHKTAPGLHMVNNRILHLYPNHHQRYQGRMELFGAKLVAVGASAGQHQHFFYYCFFVTWIVTVKTRTSIGHNMC